MDFELNRRSVLAGAGVLAACAGGYFASRDPRQMGAAFVRGSLPGISIDEASLDLCVEDYLSGLSKTEYLAAKVSWAVMGVEGMASVHPKFATAARNLLTRFLVHSNFFWLKDPRDETIVYRRPVEGVACGNPMANLSPPDPDPWEPVGL